MPDSPEIFSDLSRFGDAAGGVESLRDRFDPEALREAAQLMADIRRETVRASDVLVNQFQRQAVSPIRPLVQAAAGAIEQMFRGLVDGSVRSGRAFAAVMLDAVGKFATALGQSMVATAKVLQALMVLNIPATFAGGFALIAIGSALSAFAAGLGGSGGAATSPAVPPEPAPETPDRRLPAELTVNLVNNGGVIGIDSVRSFIVDTIRDAIGDDRLVVIQGASGIRAI